MPTYRYTVSFESDTMPVDTVRGEVVGSDEEDAVKRALRRAVDVRHKKRRPRSLVVVVEQFTAAEEKAANKIGPAFPATRPETAA